MRYTDPSGHMGILYLAQWSHWAVKSLCSGWPYYPNGPYYKPGPPLIDPDCFSDCMKTWLGGNCLNYAGAVAGAAAAAGGLSTPAWFAGLQMPAYEALGFYLGATYTARHWPAAQ